MKALRRVLLLLMVGPLATVLFLFAAMGWLLLTGPGRQQLSSRVAEATGWRIEARSGWWDPQGVSLNWREVVVRGPAGERLDLESLSIGVDPHLLFQRRIPFVTVAAPRLQLADQPDAQPGQDPASPAPPAASNGQAMPALAGFALPPVRLDRLEIDRGRLQWREWRILDFAATGSISGPDQGAFSFSARADPGGPIAGSIELGDAINARLSSKGFAAVALLRLAGVEAEEGRLSGAVDLRLERSGDIRGAGRLRLSDLRLASGWAGSTEVTLAADGSSLSAQAEGALRPPGGARALPVALTLQARRAPPAWLVESLTGAIDERNAFSLTGRIGATLNLDAEASLAQPLALARALGAVLPGELRRGSDAPWTVALALRGETDAPTWRLRLKLGPDRIRGDGFTAEGVSAELQTAGSGAVLGEPVALSLNAGRVVLGEWSIDGASVRGKLQVEADGASWRFEPARAEGRLAGGDGRGHPFTLEMAASGDLAAAPTLSFEAQATWDAARFGVQGAMAAGSLVRLSLAMPAAHPFAIPEMIPGPPPVVDLTGRLWGTLALQPAGAGWGGRGDLRVADLSWSGGEGTLLAEGVAGRAKGNFDWRPGRWRVDGEARLDGGEWLAGAFYGDLSQEAPALAFKGSERDGRLAARGLLTSATLASTTLSVGLAGEGAQRRAQGNLTVQGWDLGRLFGTYLAAPLAESDPGWGKMRLAGSLGAELAFDLALDPAPGETPGLSGWIGLNDGSLSLSEGAIGIESVNLNLPVGTERAFGLLRLEGTRLGEMVLPDIVARPGVVGDRLILDGAVRVPLFQGTLALEGVEMAEIWSAEPKLTLSARLIHMDLRAASAAFDGPDLGQAALEADFPRIVWSPGRLESRGVMTARLFGGAIRVRDLGGSELLSPTPKWGLNAEIQKLNLEDVTGFLDVGTIQGTVSGFVHDLTFSGLEPVAFHARLASVEGEAPRRISVRAIRNLNVMGSGAGGAALSQGVLSLFDDFRYGRLGFECRLVNDLFHLTGVRQDGDRHYLVVGHIIPPTVEVVSHHREIGWRDMVRRLKMVAQSSGGEGPRIE